MQNTKRNAGEMSVQPKQRQFGRGKLSLALLATASLGFPVGAWAQETPPASEQGAIESEEIIVTANKREQSIQDVPVSVTAITGDDIERLGINNYGDYLTAVAGVQFNANEPNSQRFSIRGATTDPAVAGSQLQNTVGVYLDDVPMTSLVGAPTLIDVNPIDAERIEVLRGPQGTLYGSASLGGAVNIVTASPSYDEGFGGRLAATVATTEHGEASYGGQAVVNAPIVDQRVAARLAGAYRRDGGWVDNGVHEDSNRFTEYAVRGALRLDPTERLRVDLSGTVQRSHNDDVGSINPALGDYVRDPRTRNDRVTELHFAQIRAAYEITDDLRFTISGADARVESEEVSDLFFYRPSINFYGAFLTGGPFTYVSPGGDGQYETFDSEARSGEARLYFDRGIVSALAGVFYRRESIDYTADIIAPGLAAQTAPLGALFFPNDVVLHSETDATNTEQAVFGEVTLQPGDFEFTLGARWFDNEVEQIFTQTALGSTSTFPIVSDGTGVTPKFVVAYHVDDDRMLYVSATRGYRTGFGNRPTLVPFGAPLSTDADTIWNYEAGLKSTWFDDALRLNMAVYRADWDNIQFQVRPVGSPSSFYANAGEARVEGLEIEAQLRPTDALTLSTAITLNRARLTDANGARGSLGTPLSDGNQLPGTPDFQISNTIEYRVSIGADASSFIRLDHRYFGENFAEIDNLTLQGDYNVVDLRSGVDIGRFTITGFATNLLEEEGVTFRLPASAAIIPNEQYQLRPRTIGVTVASRF